MDHHDQLRKHNRSRRHALMSSFAVPTHNASDQHLSALEVSAMNSKPKLRLRIASVGVGASCREATTARASL